MDQYVFLQGLIQSSDIFNCFVCLQLEVVYQFFVGSFDETGTHIDDFGTIARVYVLSYSGFWFDTLTSIPWSFLDFYSYHVSFLHNSKFLHSQSYAYCCCHLDVCACNMRDQ